MLEINGVTLFIVSLFIWLFVRKRMPRPVYLFDIFYIYSAFVVFLTMRPFYFQFPNHIRKFHFDVKPFYHLWHMADGYLAYQLLYSLGNILMFVPLGFLIPLLFKKMNRWFYVLVIGFSCSLMIEIVQALFTLTRRGTVDDLFFNTLGALLGYISFQIGSKMYEIIVSIKIEQTHS